MARRAVLAATLILAGASRLALAQEPTTGSIGGRVMETGGGPLPGATVAVVSSQGSRQASTDEGGRFLVPYLTPGLYTVRVELAGFAPLERGDIDVRVGHRVELALVMSPGAFSETVEVTGSTPVVDLTSAAASTTVESSFLGHVPVGRQLGDSLALAAGVSTGQGTGSANPSISGATGLENQYVVDGLSINSQRYGTLGVFHRDYGALGTGVTYDFVDEIQVRGAGTEAEYAQSTGGVVNVVTKSGSNVWHASVFGYLRPEWLEGDRREVALPSGAVNTAATETGELGFTLGGPIVKDRAFFFVAVDPQRETTTFVAPDGFPLAALGETDRTRDVVPYAAKATVQLGGSHRLDLSLFGDPAEADNGPQTSAAMLFRDAGAFSSLEYGGHNQALRYQGVLGEDWLLEASAGRSSTSMREAPAVNEWLVTDYTVRPALSSGGKGRFEPDSKGDSTQYHLRAEHVFGRHDVRVGASYEDVGYSFNDDFTGPGILLRNGMRTSTGVTVSVLTDATYGRIYRVANGRQWANRDSWQEASSFFAQDRIELGPRLTVTAGLRYEAQRIGGPSGSFTFDGNWAPRLSAVYDPSGKGRMKLFGTAGVFFARVPNNLPLYSFGANGARVLRADYFDPELTQPIPDGTQAGGTTTHLILGQSTATRYDPNAKLGYVREAVVGFEGEAAPLLSLGARLVYRDMPRVLEDVGNTALLLFVNGSGATSVNYIVANPRDGYPATRDGVGAFEDPIHRYWALELTADKRFSDGWALLASYRFSRLRGTYEGFYRSDTSQSFSAQSSLYDYPTDDPTYSEIGVPQYGFEGDIRYQGSLGEGPLPNDRPHQLKLWGSYALDSGVTLGAGVSAWSGRPLTAMAANPVSGRRGDIPTTPRGDGFETVDGFKSRTPFEWSVDLHVDLPLELMGGRVVLSADVFNLFDTDQVRDYDQDTQLGYRLVNPDFGHVTRYQEPRQVRLGVRFEL